jgi:hypothetical protein
MFSKLQIGQKRSREDRLRRESFHVQVHRSLEFVYLYYPPK